MDMVICFKKLNDVAIIPSFGHDDDTNFGVDFFACLSKLVIIPPGGSANITTGIAWMPMNVPYGHKAGMIIKSRSGLAIKNGIECSNAGVIDQGYRGEIVIKLHNTSDQEFVVEHGMRIAQGIVQVVPKYSVIEVADIDDTIRGNRGFGSSGVK